MSRKLRAPRKCPSASSRAPLTQRWIISSPRRRLSFRVALDRAVEVLDDIGRANQPVFVRSAGDEAGRVLRRWGGTLFNPTSSARGPKHVVNSGKTPVLSAKETRALPDRSDVTNLAGLRDRAFLAALVYSFARAAGDACIMGLPAVRGRLRYGVGRAVIRLAQAGSSVRWPSTVVFLPL